MININEHRLKILRSQYPKGCVVELVSMDDKQARPVGTKGKVLFVDDVGTIHIKWESGSTLGVVAGIDLVKKIEEEIPSK